MCCYRKNNFQCNFIARTIFNGFYRKTISIAFLQEEQFPMHLYIKKQFSVYFYRKNNFQNLVLWKRDFPVHFCREDNFEWIFMGKQFSIHLSTKFLQGRQIPIIFSQVKQFSRHFIGKKLSKEKTNSTPFLQEDFPMDFYKKAISCGFLQEDHLLGIFIGKQIPINFIRGKQFTIHYDSENNFYKKNYFQSIFIGVDNFQNPLLQEKDFAFLQGKPFSNEFSLEKQIQINFYRKANYYAFYRKNDTQFIFIGMIYGIYFIGR